MIETKRTSALVETVIVGERTGYHGFVQLRDGKVNQMSLYQGTKQIAIALSKDSFVVMADVLNTMIDVANGVKE
jgi:hypothetical protein